MGFGFGFGFKKVFSLVLGGGTSPDTDNLLLESGNNFLLEDGFKLLL